MKKKILSYSAIIGSVVSMAVLTVLPGLASAKSTAFTRVENIKIVNRTANPLRFTFACTRSSEASMDSTLLIAPNGNSDAYVFTSHFPSDDTPLLCWGTGKIDGEQDTLVWLHIGTDISCSIEPSQADKRHLHCRRKIVRDKSVKKPSYRFDITYIIESTDRPAQ